VTRSNLLETRENVLVDNLIRVGVIWVGTGGNLEQCYSRSMMNYIFIDVPGGDLRMPGQDLVRLGPLAHLANHPLQEQY
jgi:hypothetical protein